MDYKTRSPFPSQSFAETQRPFRRIVKSLTSGLSNVIIDGTGDFLYIDQASTGYVTVELNTAAGASLDPITLAAGASIEANFSKIKLNADAQLNKSVTLIIGNGARIKGGANVNADSAAINVVDGGLTRTLANEAFVGTAYNTATVGQQAHVQLWNPATSGKNVYLTQFLTTVEAAQSLLTCHYNAAYATNVAQAHSKLIGGAAPAAQVRAMTSGGALGTAYGIQIVFNAAGAYFHKFSEPVVIPPGYGFGLISGYANTRVFLSPEWYEK